MAANDLIGATDLFQFAREMTRALVKEVAREVLAGLQGPQTAEGWIDQRRSPLGARLHCKAVRRRLSAGKGGARHDQGRRLYLLTPEALNEEMMQSPKPGLRKTRPAPALSTVSPASGKDARVQARLEELRALRRGK